VLKPFYTIIKDLQALRLEYPKGHVKNMLYKEIGNSIYGNVVRELEVYLIKRDSIPWQKHKQTKKNFRVGATVLSNPILVSLTTAFIRSVIGECWHKIQKLGGLVVSTTTDGFITDIA